MFFFSCMFSQSFLCSRHRSGLLRLLHRSRGFVTHCRSRGALAMYAWGQGGRLYRSGTSNVPEPPDTAVADTLQREREALPDSGASDDSRPDRDGNRPDWAHSPIVCVAESSHPRTLADAALAAVRRKRQTEEDTDQCLKRRRGSGGRRGRRGKR